MTSKQDTPTLYRRKHSKTGKVYTFAKFDGKQVSFGPWGIDAQERFARYLVAWKANGRQAPVTEPTITVAALAAAFQEHADGYYRRPDGSPTGEARNVGDALAPLIERFGALDAERFGPAKLAELRDELVTVHELARTTINGRIHTIRRAFRWAAARELIPGTVVAALDQLDGLHRGRSEARETEPVKPVSLQDVEATVPYLSRQVAALVWLQWWSGMRPGEVVQFRPRDIERSGPVRIYRPSRHKTEHHGRQRQVDLGPRAQEILAPFLSRVRLDPDAPLFRPDEAEAERNADRRRTRRSPMTPSQARRARKERPKLQPSDRYDVHAYRRAVHHAVDAANAARVREAIAAAAVPFAVPSRREPLRLAVSWVGVSRLVETREPDDLDVVRLERVFRRFLDDFAAPEALGAAIRAARDTALMPRWAPNQLRHAAATRLRKEVGLEAARVVLGHARASVTEVYAEIDHERSRAIMARLG